MTSSQRLIPAPVALACAIAIAIASASSARASSADDAALKARVDRVLTAMPIIDGHNDLAWELRERFASGAGIDLRSGTATLAPSKDGPAEQTPLMTDIPRLRKGHVGGQFWSVWIPASVTGPAAVKMTVEQIDIVHAMVARYPQDFAMAYSAEDILRVEKSGRIASLIGIEGGSQIDDSLPMLRQMYVLGARYMTLTHALNNDWADSATDAPKHHGLTPFGLAVVHEMNRLGMLVDLSHVSPETMKAAITASVAPVMFSHSGARALDDHPRDVPDDVLAEVAKNRGIVMVNFAPQYVSEERARWESDHAAEKTRFNAPPFAGLYIGQPERAQRALAEWESKHPVPVVTIAMVADHIEHIRKVAGVDCIGIGSDFDGIPTTPQGLDGVDKYPALILELARRGWTDQALAKVAGGNILRVLHEAEVVAKKLQASEPQSAATIEALDGAAKK